MGRLSRRQRQTAWSLVATVVGCGALLGLARVIDTARDTDLADPTRNVRSDFVSGGVGNETRIRLRDVAREVGLEFHHAPAPRSMSLPEDTGSGLAWGDYDGDGDFDLYVVNYPTPSADGPGSRDADARGVNRLFRNDGARFVDVTDVARVADESGFGMGASFADFDGDGWLDLYVTNRGPNRLYRNLGDGSFDDVADERGVADPAWSTGVAWGDFDRDGFLDLYVCNYVTYDPTEAELDAAKRSNEALPVTLNPNAFDPEPNRLYRNRGDGTFADVAVAAGVDDPNGRSLAATFCDLDGDGWLDLYVNNDVSKNRLFRNRGADAAAGDDRFEDVSTLTGTADPRGSMGLSVAEVGDMTGNGDGLPDLFITHWVAQENALYQSLITSQGGLEYRDRTRALRLGEISVDAVGWGTSFVDLDLDADVDLAVANGSTLQCQDDPSRLVAQPFFLFSNEGASFRDVAAQVGPELARPLSARGLAAADYDGDGDVDLAVSLNRGRLMLLANESEGPRNALAVRLAGPSSAAFGARLEVACGAERQYRWYGADVSFLSMHATDVVFGLGNRTTVDILVVRWADGAESELRDLPAGRTTVVHPSRASPSESHDRSKPNSNPAQ